MYARRATRPKPRTAALKMFPAPVGGWVSNRNLADSAVPGEPQGAAILDNFFPRATSVVLRRGKQLYATLGGGGLPCTSLFTFVDGLNERLFGTTQEAIYDITNVISPANYTIGTEDGDDIGTQDGDVFGGGSTDGLEVIQGLTGGDWSTVQFAVTGGTYLVGVNGQDAGFLYDGSTFTPYGATVTFPGIVFGTTDLTTADMSFVWVYKERLWFVQKDSLNAWYMDVDSISGTAKLFPLAGVFGMGGSLMWGQNWSMDTSGQGGLAEQCVFVSTEGEVAIYQGINPDQAATWNKVGLYRIGTPLGKRAFLRGGGDIAVATSVGLVPLSKAITLDVTSLTVASVSYKIADAWHDAVSSRGAAGWQCQIWPEERMAVVSPPDLIGSSLPVLFVTNTETGAWARYTNWQALSMAVFRGGLYFGSPEGKVFLANVSGLDDADTYSGTVMPLFEDLGTPASAKVGKVARAVVRASVPINDRVEMHTDFDISVPTPPDATAQSAGNTWGAGVWGTTIWGETAPSVINQEWRSVGGIGYSCSVSFQVTSGATAPIDAELIRLELTTTAAEVIT